MPKRAAPAAPAKPMCESAWAANDERRNTMKYPMMPATMATIVPASKACRMKAYRHIVWRSLRIFQLKSALFMMMYGFIGADNGYPATRIS